ncbi:hypothetical protein A2U01_0101756 [Trifolium medium]|uniref:Uncharacterized protein n=1 Tax=Trifolium medium TaxID=97028 RepID=A0A392V0I9_9FABA|nr:hypothetical protein [Trifolium medium]
MLPNLSFGFVEEVADDNFHTAFACLKTQHLVSNLDQSLN